LIETITQDYSPSIDLAFCSAQALQRC